MLLDSLGQVALFYGCITLKVNKKEKVHYQLNNGRFLHANLHQDGFCDMSVIISIIIKG